VLDAHQSWAADPGLLEVCRKAIGDLRRFIEDREPNPTVCGVLEFCDGAAAGVDELLAALPGPDKASRASTYDRLAVR
jgi:hypothetical protein